MRSVIEKQGEALIVREPKSAVVGFRLCMHDHGACGRKAAARGLCMSHLQALYRLIRESEGKVTLLMMERAGRCLPAKRPAKAWFLEGIAH